MRIWVYGACQAAGGCGQADRLRSCGPPPNVMMNARALEVSLTKTIRLVRLTIERGPHLGPGCRPRVNSRQRNAQLGLRKLGRQAGAAKRLPRVSNDLHTHEANNCRFPKETQTSKIDPHVHEMPGRTKENKEVEGGLNKIRRALCPGRVRLSNLLYGAPQRPCPGESAYLHLTCTWVDRCQKSK